MIREAIEYLMAQSAQRATPITLEIDDPTKKHYIIEGKGLVVPIPRPPREHSVNSLDDLVSAASSLSDENDVVVFFDSESVVAILDNDGHRIEWITFELRKSDQWQTVNSMGKWHDQKAFVRLLKIDLAGCLAPVELLEIVRRVKFENGTTVKSEVGRQKESIGREIRSQVETERDVPDDVLIQVPVYKSMGERDKYGLRCSVEVDPMQGTFRLAPMPDEIERVQHSAMAYIRERLVAGLPDVPVFYGSP